MRSFHHVAKISVLGSRVVLVLLVTGCTDPVRDYFASAPKNSLLNDCAPACAGGPGTTVPDSEVNARLNDCATARTQGRLREFTRTVRFPGSATGCHWEFNNDNLVQGYYEEIEQFSLPQGARLCDMKFQFPENQMIRYDDELLLLLDDYVLLSSRDFSHPEYYGPGHGDWSLTTTEEGFVRYDWEHMKHLWIYTDISSRNAPPYCLGTGRGSRNAVDTCRVPFTEQRGQFKLDIPQPDLTRLALKLGKKFNQPGQNSHPLKFRMIALGEGDLDVDCKHTEIRFDAKVSYVQN